MSETTKQIIREAALDAVRQGFRAFISESGTYGFVTNADETQVVSFQCSLSGAVECIGQYKTSKPQQTGSGWVIGEYKGKWHEMFQPPPRWAVGRAEWEYTPLKKYLALYQRSSRFTEVFDSNHP